MGVATFAGMFLGTMTGLAVMVFNETAAMVTMIAGMWLGLSFGIWFGFWVSKPRQPTVAIVLATARTQERCFVKGRPWETRSSVTGNSWRR